MISKRSPVSKVTAAIVGPGNIGTDLLVKLLPQRPDRRCGTWSASTRHRTGWPGPGRSGWRPRRGGVDWLLGPDELPDLVFEATSAKAHLANAPRYAEAGIPAVDLTPAAVGPFVCPPVNLDEHRDAPNLNMITCGGQATIPMVARGVAR